MGMAGSQRNAQAAWCDRDRGALGRAFLGVADSANRVPVIQRQWPVWQRAAAELTAPAAAPMASQWALRFRRSQKGPPFAAVTAASRSRVRARILEASSEAFCLAAVS